MLLISCPDLWNNLHINNSNRLSCRQYIIVACTLAAAILAIKGRVPPYVRVVFCLVQFLWKLLLVLSLVSVRPTSTQSHILIFHYILTILDCLHLVLAGFLPFLAGTDPSGQVSLVLARLITSQGLVQRLLGYWNFLVSSLYRVSHPHNWKASHLTERLGH